MRPDRLSRHLYRKAAEHLRGAAIILRTEDPPIPWPLVCFLSQQAAENYLKGWLVSRGRAAPRTHDLEHLVQQASRIEAKFDSMLEAASQLSAFAVTPRYPGETPDPGEPEARRAFKHAEAIRDFVETLGPPPPEQALPLT